MRITVHAAVVVGYVLIAILVRLFTCSLMNSPLFFVSLLILLEQALTDRASRGLSLMPGFKSKQGKAATKVGYNSSMRSMMRLYVRRAHIISYASVYCNLFV